MPLCPPAPCAAGLGTETVQTILQHFPTPLALYSRYSSALREAAAHGRDPATAATNVLLGLKRREGGRPVGQDKAQRVFQLLFATGWGAAAGAGARF